MKDSSLTLWSAALKERKRIHTCMRESSISEVCSSCDARLMPSLPPSVSVLTAGCVSCCRQTHQNKNPFSTGEPHTGNLHEENLPEYSQRDSRPELQANGATHPALQMLKSCGSTSAYAVPKHTSYHCLIRKRFHPRHWAPGSPVMQQVPHMAISKGDARFLFTKNLKDWCSVRWGRVRTRRCRKVECREVPPGGKMATSLLLPVRAQVRAGARSEDCCFASGAGESTLHFFAGLPLQKQRIIVSHGPSLFSGIASSLQGPPFHILGQLEDVKVKGKFPQKPNTHQLPPTTSHMRRRMHPPECTLHVLPCMSLDQQATLR